MYGASFFEDHGHDAGNPVQRNVTVFGYGGGMGCSAAMQIRVAA